MILTRSALAPRSLRARSGSTLQSRFIWRIFSLVDRACGLAGWFVRALTRCAIAERTKPSTPLHYRGVGSGQGRKEIGSIGGGVFSPFPPPLLTPDRLAVSPRQAWPLPRCRTPSRAPTRP